MATQIFVRTWRSASRMVMLFELKIGYVLASANKKIGQLLHLVI